MTGPINRLLKITFLLLVMLSTLQAQNQDNRILKRTVELNLRASIWEAVHDLAEKGIPIGFEAREHWNVYTDTRVVLSGGTVEEILNSIVKQDASYRWEEVDGVINIYPVKDRFEKSASFLATRLVPVTIYSSDDRATTVEKFSNLFVNASHDGADAEIQFHSSIGRGHPLGSREKCSETINIPATDDVKTALNKITKCQPVAPLWKVTPTKDRKGIIVVF